MPIPYLPTFESQKTEHAILRGSEATKPKGGKLLRGGGCPPSHGRELLHFWTSNCAIWYSGAYLERKFRLKIYCIAWKATNLKIPKTECSVFLGFKNFKNRTVLLKTERLASLQYIPCKNQSLWNVSAPVSSTGLSAQSLAKSASLLHQPWYTQTGCPHVFHTSGTRTPYSNQWRWHPLGGWNSSGPYHQGCRLLSRCKCRNL